MPRPAAGGIALSWSPGAYVGLNRTLQQKSDAKLRALFQQQMYARKRNRAKGIVVATPTVLKLLTISRKLRLACLATL